MAHVLHQLRGKRTLFPHRMHRLDEFERVRSVTAGSHLVRPDYVSGYPEYSGQVSQA